jgi:hypothetical protein
MSEQNMTWFDVKVVLDDSVTELFEMTTPDRNPEQKPAFRITSATAALVEKDFELYKPSLERMIDDWRESKARFMQEQSMAKKGARK